MRKLVFNQCVLIYFILPGGGGTQRLPKLLDLPGALDMVLTGKTLRADKAKKMGLVDELVNDLGTGLKPGDERTLAYLKEAAVKSAKNLAGGTLKPKNLLEKLIGMALQYDLVKDQVTRSLRRRRLRS